MTRTTRQQVNKKHSGDNKTLDVQRESNVEVGNPDSRGDVIFSNDGPGGMVLGNAIIMEKISSYLGSKDLCHWYASSRRFRDIIQHMDDSTWRRRTQKLAKALNMEIPPERTSREMFPIFKKEVDSLISHIRESGRYLSLELFLTAARLAHYGQIEFDHLILQDLDLSTVPREHLCSLASSVKDMFDIQGIRGCDLIKIIDSTKCYKLGIFNLKLDREATEAVVRAMDTRIQLAKISVCKMYRFQRREQELKEKDIRSMLDTKALTKYNGKGRCKNIILRVGQVDKYRQWLRDWAKARDWTVYIEDESGMGVGIKWKTET